MNPLLIIFGTAVIFVLAFRLATIAWMAMVDYFEELIPLGR
jgi:hypothetical protein